MSRIYADIIVDISQEKLDKSFQYEIPEELQGQVEIGKRVRIPFGNGGRELTGYVIGLSEEPKIEPDRIKAILAVEDRGMEIESRLISLAGWIARQYGSGIKNRSSRQGKRNGKGEEIPLSGSAGRGLYTFSGRVQEKTLQSKRTAFAGINGKENTGIHLCCGRIENYGFSYTGTGGKRPS